MPALANASPLRARRRLLLAGVALAGIPLLGMAQSGGRVTLAAAVSLPDELALALRAKQPLVVLVSLDGCPFCRGARDSYLGPMRDEHQQAMVQVDMLSKRRVIDFSGKSVTHDDLVKAWAISVAPTVLFFGPGGKELAPRLAGASLPDFYGAYLDERVRTARLASAR